MSQQIAVVDHKASLSLPQEAIDALRLNNGGEVNIEIVGCTLIICSVAEAGRARGFAQAFQFVLKRRKGAYKQLAEGPS